MYILSILEAWLSLALELTAQRSAANCLRREMADLEDAVVVEEMSILVTA
jgi:hypothetical protein